MALRQEIIKQISSRYFKASKKEKKVILDEQTKLLKIHRKSLIRRINRTKKYIPSCKKSGRKKYYDLDVNIALGELAPIADNICPERLKSEIPKLIRKQKQFKRWNYSEEVTSKVLKISISSIKRILGDRRQIPLKGKSTTKRSKLKDLIAIVRKEPTNKEVGYGQIDSVAHCGDTIHGDYAFTVNYTDIATTWAISHAQLNKGEKATVTSIEIMYKQLPFKIKWLHPDSGSEFINYHLYNWTKERGIVLCRSKPNNSNDNEYIEQKNYTTVREYFGTKRIETKEAIELMNYLYEGSLYFYINFFLPTMKCIKKRRKGNKIKRIYDKPKTPFERLMANQQVTKETKQMLLSVYKDLDPVELKNDIENTLIKIFKLR